MVRGKRKVGLYLSEDVYKRLVIDHERRGKRNGRGGKQTLSSYIEDLLAFSLPHYEAVDKGDYSKEDWGGG